MLVGAGDQGKDARGNCVFIPLKLQGRVKCSETKHHDQSLRSPPCGIKPFHWDGESRNFAAFWQPCVCLGVSSCVSIFMYIVQYDATAGGGCVYMCIRYHEMVEGTEPLHGFAEDSNLFIH